MTSWAAGRTNIYLIKMPPRLVQRMAKQADSRVSVKHREEGTNQSQTKRKKTKIEEKDSPKKEKTKKEVQAASPFNTMFLQPTKV